MFWLLALATCLQLDSVAKIVCFAQMGQFLNVFSFSLELLWLFIVFLTWNTLKLTVSPFNIPLFFIISTSNLQEKGMVFLFLSTYFMFWVLFTWICELLIWFGIFVVSVMGWTNVCLCLFFFFFFGVLLIKFLGFYF